MGQKKGVGNDTRMLRISDTKKLYYFRHIFVYDLEHQKLCHFWHPFVHDLEHAIKNCVHNFVRDLEHQNFDFENIELIKVNKS